MLIELVFKVINRHADVKTDIPVFTYGMTKLLHFKKALGSGCLV